MSTPAFPSLTEAFLYCRDMDASLNERLEAFSEATRYLIPGYQEAVDRMVERLKAHDAGAAAPKPGEAMPPFAMPDEKGQLVTLDDLLKEGPLAMTFHRGHWCPYCRINTRAWPKPRPRSASEGGRLAAIMPERQAIRGYLQSRGRGALPHPDRHRQWLRPVAEPCDLGGGGNAADIGIGWSQGPRLSGQRGLGNAHSRRPSSSPRTAVSRRASSIPTTASA